MPRCGVEHDPGPMLPGWSIYPPVLAPDTAPTRPAVSVPHAGCVPRVEAQTLARVVLLADPPRPTTPEPQVQAVSLDEVAVAAEAGDVGAEVVASGAGRAPQRLRRLRPEAADEVSHLQLRVGRDIPR